MTQTLDEIQQRLQSIKGLGEIVSAMRALAAMRNQEAQSRIAGARAYAEILRHALLRALDLVPGRDDRATNLPESQPRALLAFCAEYGFAGGFTRRIVETIAKSPRDLLWIVGRRGVLLCEEEKLPVDWSAPMATQADAILDTVQRVAGELHRRYSTKTLGPFDLVYARREGLGFTLERQSLLPIAPIAAPGDHGAYPPLLNEPPEALIAALIEEYLFAAITHAACESFFSENTARLMTMDAARHNIDEKFESLTTEERRVRQEETTTELFDVMTGVEAAR